MRHLNRKVHLNRSRSHRRALFSNLSAQLFVHKRIITTLAKAKYTRQYAERMITFARRGSLADRRHVLKFITNRAVVKTLFDDLGIHFKNRDGGYTRVIRLGFRKGDAAPMAILELVGFDDVPLEVPKTKGKSRLKAAQKKAVDEKVIESEVVDVAGESSESEAEAPKVTAAETAASEEVQFAEADKSEEAESAPEENSADKTDESDAKESDKKE